MSLNLIILDTWLVHQTTLQFMRQMHFLAGLNSLLKLCHIFLPFVHTFIGK